MFRVLIRPLAILFHKSNDTKQSNRRAGPWLPCKAIHYNTLHRHDKLQNETLCPLLENENPKNGHFNGVCCPTVHTYHVRRVLGEIESERVFTRGNWKTNRPKRSKSSIDRSGPVNLIKSEPVTRGCRLRVTQTATHPNQVISKPLCSSLCSSSFAASPDSSSTTRPSNKWIARSECAA